MVRIGPKEVDVADPAAAREVHRMGTVFTKAPFYRLLSPGPVDNIFNFRDQKKHSQRRKLYAKGFTLVELRRNWETTINKTIRMAVQKMKEEAANGDTELMGWWTLMANEIVCRLTFNGGHGTVEKGIKDPFVLMLEKRKGDLAHLLKMFIPPLYYVGRVLGKVNTRMNDIFYSQEKMFKAGAGVVQSARQDKEAGEFNQNLFAKALQEGEGDAATLTDTDIMTDAGALLLAGSDPTAISLTFLVYLVLSRPELQKQLEEEVASIDGEVTDTACEGLPLMNAVIDESMRLYGAAPGGLPRSPAAGGAKLGGYYMPEGTVVDTQNRSLHTDEGTWKDGQAFDHTRFLPENRLEFSAHQKMAFNPFGQGSRQCLGIHLGKLEMRLAVAHFFRELRGAKLAKSATPESMAVVDSFVAGVPRERKCEVTMKARSDAHVIGVLEPREKRPSSSSGSFTQD
ncbi:Cytochrome P450 monooxygenase cypX [Fulvia fulva]|uniref:Cytochrome P450 monooxygenase cypX n=1 Tax=Passalora fulva TaxID=5499 RepID=A0A9Q8PML3_PASFU|nr:Cytochrome P450 monooxygenase cypX [Fulvia fulva]UJO25205.1 Cytochrome P450 monooxygenase cypX [Fulvia fulva]WPV22527.1 Cytochrome P450 monooxygenase cypX [Fulvia fulva]